MRKQITNVLARLSTAVGCLAIAPVIVLALTSPLHAGPLEDGVEAVQIHDYPEALRLLRPLAENGNAAAQFNIGVMYEHGRGVQQSYAEAANWYRRSSDQGYGEGQFSLGFLHYKGLGVPRDMVAASVWFVLASARIDDDCHKENAIVHLELAAMKMTGAEQDEAARRAAEWKPKPEYPVTGHFPVAG